MPSDPFIGEVFMGGFNFAPRGYASCQGQLLAISQNTALFSLLGTTYGGDGQVTFALPDLRGRVPMNYGTGPGLSPRSLGEKGGSETVTLTQGHLPAHSHPVQGVTDAGDTNDPSGAYLANTGSLDKEFKTSGTPVNMHGSMIGYSGNNQPVPNMQPFLALNFYIALQGIFPSRN